MEAQRAGSSLVKMVGEMRRKVIADTEWFVHDYDDDRRGKERENHDHHKGNDDDHHHDNDNGDNDNSEQWKECQR
ncbi:unnamed protein product [Allacma fusca]|uniref:Uncharacterized protein n=1 Tax=Allacma fusca TaxID=39272 RepID=A0A8J2JV57_9HEXA|nr:unnamed protein product [Allacma fusca]